MLKTSDVIYTGSLDNKMLLEPHMRVMQDIDRLEAIRIATTRQLSDDSLGIALNIGVWRKKESGQLGKGFGVIKRLGKLRS